MPLCRSLSTPERSRCKLSGFESFKDAGQTDREFGPSHGHWISNRGARTLLVLQQRSKWVLTFQYRSNSVP